MPSSDTPKQTLITTATTSLEPVIHSAYDLEVAGQVANEYAAHSAVADYLSRKSDNTIRSHAASLKRFAEYLDAIGDGLGDGLAEFALAVADFPNGPAPDAEAWRGVSWGLVEGFRNWMVQEGDAVSSINVRLSAVKAYAKLATKAEVLTPEAHAMIRTVVGYSPKEGKRVNERREVSRRGHKKAHHVSISQKQARKLKKQPDTPQGRRDAVIMCLLLDNGLRVGELARLLIEDFDLNEGEMVFYRPKVDKTQRHELSEDVLRALRAWMESGDAPQSGPLLRGSRKGGALTDAGMSAWSISMRVRALGAQIGLEGLSAHDCRHYWATFWARKVDVLRLQEAGGWSSLAMPRRYVEDSEIANKGMV